jgi:hypothetical protein
LRPAALTLLPFVVEFGTERFQRAPLGSSQFRRIDDRQEARRFFGKIEGFGTIRTAELGEQRRPFGGGASIGCSMNRKCGGQDS